MKYLLFGLIGLLFLLVLVPLSIAPLQVSYPRCEEFTASGQASSPENNEYIAGVVVAYPEGYRENPQTYFEDKKINDTKIEDYYCSLSDPDKPYTEMENQYVVLSKIKDCPNGMNVVDVNLILRESLVGDGKLSENAITTAYQCKESSGSTIPTSSECPEGYERDPKTDLCISPQQTEAQEVCTVDKEDNPFEVATAVTGKGTYTDECIGEKKGEYPYVYHPQLTEYFCKEGKELKKKIYNCNCLEGACEACTDTDRGSVYEQGIVTGFNEIGERITRKDYCIDDKKTLVEFSCSGDISRPGNKKYVFEEKIKCPYGYECSDGKCELEKEIQENEKLTNPFSPSIFAACQEDDDGYDIHKKSATRLIEKVKGTLTGKVLWEETDRCVNRKVLEEFLCEPRDSSSDFVFIDRYFDDCGKENSCIDGACVKPSPREFFREPPSVRIENTRDSIRVFIQYFLNLIAKFLLILQAGPGQVPDYEKCKIPYEEATGFSYSLDSIAYSDGSVGRQNLYVEKLRPPEGVVEGGRVCTFDDSKPYDNQLDFVALEDYDDPSRQNPETYEYYQFKLEGTEAERIFGDYFRETRNKFIQERMQDFYKMENLIAEDTQPNQYDNNSHTTVSELDTFQRALRLSPSILVKDTNGLTHIFKIASNFKKFISIEHRTVEDLKTYAPWLLEIAGFGDLAKTYSIKKKAEDFLGKMVVELDPDDPQNHVKWQQATEEFLRAFGKCETGESKEPIMVSRTISDVYNTPEFDIWKTISVFSKGLSKITYVAVPSSYRASVSGGRPDDQVTVITIFVNACNNPDSVDSLYVGSMTISKLQQEGYYGYATGDLVFNDQQQNEGARQLASEAVSAIEGPIKNTADEKLNKILSRNF